jgi:hypothetical protein
LSKKRITSRTLYPAQPQLQLQTPLARELSCRCNRLCSNSVRREGNPELGLGPILRRTPPLDVDCVAGGGGSIDALGWRPMTGCFGRRWNEFIRAGNLRVTTAAGSTLALGDGTGAPVAIRFTTGAAERGC